MLVTKHNQHIALDDFKEALAKSEFCAFDEEMTGVDCSAMPLTFGDTPDAVYESRKVACEMFNAFQFGVALFIPRGDTGYDVLPYNFFLLNADGDVRLDLKVVPFHNANHMDFQRWLAVGMRYCTAAEEAEQRKQICAAPALIDDGDKHVYEKIIRDAQAWYDKQRHANQAEDKEEEEEKKEKTKENVLSVTAACSYAVAKAVKHHIDTQTTMPLAVRYDGKPYLGENLVFNFEKIDEDTWRASRGRAEQDRARKVQALLGFREFWNALVASGKPVVGHNCYQDLMFMIHMHEHALPDSYDEFKCITSTAFPCVYDTKTLATTLTGEHAFAQTHLGGVYTEVRKRFGCVGGNELRKAFRLPPGFYDYDEVALKGGSKAHEAGFDAYMTGICFHFLRQLHNKDSLQNCKNVVSVFGSVYYCCLAENKDRLVVPSTFIIRSSKPCHLEQVEALLFMSQDRDKVVVDGKVDVRRLSYKANCLSKTPEGLCTSVCVVFRTEESVESVSEMLTNAAASEAAANVPVALIPHLTVSAID